MSGWLRRLLKLPMQVPQTVHLGDGYWIYTTEADQEITAADLLNDPGQVPGAHIAADTTCRKTSDALRDALIDPHAAATRLAEDLHAALPGLNDKTSVTCLLDLSGSLNRGDKLEMAMMIGGVISHLCLKLDIPFEVLGFTTREWKGEPVRLKWLMMGQPEHPGRLCALRHIVFSDFKTKEHPHMTAMFLPDLLKENVDGEAILWAAERARRAETDRHLLIVVSDGAPVDDSTLSVNAEGFLWDHLKAVIAEMNRAEDMALLGVGLDHDLSRLYPVSVLMKFHGELESVLLPALGEAIRNAAVPAPVAVAGPAPEQERHLAAAIAAQADMHHRYLLGLQLMVSTRHGAGAIGDWMFRLFRRQHEAKFLSSFAKLGLAGLPHAVACARYHVLSNGIGGVPVEYMEESPRKAWVRFRYPRWMFDGPAICGIPIEASRGFLRGWYAQNGVSLGNPRLGFVCVSEDMAGYGLCGYFHEYDHDLAPEERLRFAPEERPPVWDPAGQPAPPPGEWTPERLARANRNYAVEYIRNGLATLIDTLGRDAALPLAQEAARLTGLQSWRPLAAMGGLREDGPREAGAFLAWMFRGMGDDIEIEHESDTTVIHHTNLRLARGLDEPYRSDLLTCWIELWRGTVHAQRTFMDLTCHAQGEGIIWCVSARSSRVA